MSQDLSRTVLLLSADLFFGSKVTGTARMLGYPAFTVGSLEVLKQRLTSTGCGLLLIDLGMGDLHVSDVVSLLPLEDRPRVIAFGSHVDTNRLQEARDAGCDEVMPRSRFSSTLPDLLKSYLDGEKQS